MVEAGITPAQCRAGREAVGLSQKALASAAGVSRPVVQDFERRERVPIVNNLRAIRSALEAAGVQFEPAVGGRAGVSFTDEDAE